MVSSLRRWTVAVVAAIVVPTAASPAFAQGDAAVDVLVYTGTEGDPHASTDESVELLEMHGRRYGFAVTTSDDPGVFTPERLSDVDVVMWLNNTGTTLDESGRAAFEAFVGAGGGVVAVHAAGRAEPDWPFMSRLLVSRPVSDEGEPATERPISVDTGHPVTASMPVDWDEHADQWYRYDRDPASVEGVRVLATAAEGSVPLVWCQEIGGGRVVYTGLGHQVKAYQNGDFLRLLRGAIWWTAADDEPILVTASDAAPPWPYVVSFLAWIAAIAAGGTIAVVRLNSREALP